MFKAASLYPAKRLAQRVDKAVITQEASSSRLVELEAMLDSKYTNGNLHYNTVQARNS
jgi:hypothetical protein